jgi:type I restriction enzyme S subunit
LGYALTTPRAVAQKSQRGRGDIIVHVSVGALKQLTLPVPSRDEQVAIVKYLAHAHARIDRTIAAKRKLIALLEEQKQAAIQQAVTRGLDPSVPLKDSGIPWLGKIPAHWAVHRAKHIFNEFDTRSGTGLEPLLSLRAAAGLVFHADFSARPIGPEALVKYKKVAAGHFVMNRMRAASGLFAISANDGLVSPDYSTMEVSESVDGRFYLRLVKTRAAMAEFRRQSSGLGTGESGFMRLYSENFGRIALPVPPLVEQKSILAELADFEQKDREIAARTRKEIELLVEFRTRLTSDVVTGQVDIREIAATLTELLDEPITNLAVAEADDDAIEIECDPDGADE